MYNYQEQKANLFTEDGIGTLIEMRDKAKQHIKQSGAFIAHKIFVTGDVWTMLAVLDYMVEQKEIREIPYKCAGQDRVFISNGSNF